MRCSLVFAMLALALVLVAPALARKGDIVPLAGKGVAVIERDGHKVSRTQLGALEVEIGVSTGAGFLLVQTKVTNGGGEAYELKPGQLTVSSGGSDVDPLDPQNYIELAYQVQPYEVKDGKIIEDRTRPPIKAFTPGGQVPGTSSGASLAEQMANDQWEEGSRNQRMECTRELLAMKKDALRYGGSVAPKKSVTGKLAFQRNQLDLPFDVHFVAGGKRLTVRFAREK